MDKKSKISALFSGFFILWPLLWIPISFAWSLGNFDRWFHLALTPISAIMGIPIWLSGELAIKNFAEFIIPGALFWVAWSLFFILLFKSIKKETIQHRQNTDMMRWYRIAAYFFGWIACFISVFAYLEWLYLLGFPDGSVTELERGEKILFTIFVWISLASGLWLFLLGWIGSKKKFGRLLRATLLSYVVLLIFTFGIDFYLHRILMDGGGG